MIVVRSRCRRCRRRLVGWSVGLIAWLRFDFETNKQTGEEHSFIHSLIHSPARESGWTQRIDERKEGRKERVERSVGGGCGVAVCSGATTTTNQRTTNERTNDARYHNKPNQRRFACAIYILYIYMNQFSKYLFHSQPIHSVI